MKLWAWYGKKKKSGLKTMPWYSIVKEDFTSITSVNENWQQARSLYTFFLFSVLLSLHRASH